MPIRLLAIDIDGTLLTDDRVIHPENARAICKAQEAGILVVPASGRIASSLVWFSEELGLGGAMICSNGSHVTGPDGGELLYLGLSSEAVGITLDYTQRVGVHTSAYTRRELFFLTDDVWNDVYRRRVRSVVPQQATAAEVRGLDLLKLILIDDPSGIQRHRQALSAVLDASLAVLTESEAEYLEVLSPAANKGMGLRVLSEALGISREETAAIGDYLNDVEMVEWAGIGGAVANAAPEVHAVADLHVGSNNEGGVAEFIDCLLALNERDRTAGACPA